MPDPKFNPLALTIEQRREQRTNLQETWRRETAEWEKARAGIGTMIWWIVIAVASVACLWKLAHCIPWGGQ